MDAERMSDERLRALVNGAAFKPGRRGHLVRLDHPIWRRGSGGLLVNQAHLFAAVLVALPPDLRRVGAAALGDRIGLADVLQPLHANLGNLQVDAAGPARHVDAWTPEQPSALFGGSIVKTRRPIAMPRRQVIAGVWCGPCLAHPQPISGLAVGAAFGIALLAQALMLVHPLEIARLHDSPCLRLRTSQQRAHHRRGKEDRALSHRRDIH